MVDTTNSHDLRDGIMERKDKSMCQKFLAAISLTKEGASPVNWRVLSLVVLSLFSSCYSITFLFPFLPDMILHFGYKEEQKGYFAGMIASSMFAGRIFGSYFWGWLSDWKGRKPVMLLCLGLILLTNIGFGFSVNLAMAMVFRFFSGLFNGTVGTCKCVLYDISDNTNQAIGMSAVAVAWGAGIISGPLISGLATCGRCTMYDVSDNTNQAVAMTMFSNAWSLGVSIAPAISGYLASPATKYPSWFSETGIFGKFPFLLPSLVASIFGVISIAFIWPLMPETLQLKRKKADMVLEVQEEESLINKTSNRVGEIQPLKPLINRQLSKVKGSDVLCNSNSQQSLTNDKDTTAKSFSPSIKSLEFADASEKVKKHDPSSCVYGYGCVVTSQGDLLFPDIYSSKSRSLSNLVKRQRSRPSESHSTKDDVVNKSNGLGTSYNDVRNTSSLPELNQSQSASVPHIPGTDADNIKDDYTNTDNPNENAFYRCWTSMKNTNFIRLMKYSDVRSAILIYSLLSFAAIGFDDVFTIWASTDVMYSGLGFTTDKIGNAIGLSSLPLIILQVILFPKLEARFGSKWVLNFFCMFLILFCTILPSLRIIQDHTVPFWTLLLLFMGVNKIATTSCFSANGLHINNSVPPQFAGSANGIAMTFTAIGRTIAPVFGGSVFAWSITYGVKIGFPFDVNLVFIIFSFVYLIGNIMAALLPKSLDKQKLKHASMIEDLDTD